MEIVSTVVSETRRKAASKTSVERVAVGVKVISDNAAPFTQNERMIYLLDAGLSQDEYLQALDLASDGELTK